MAFIEGFPLAIEDEVCGIELPSAGVLVRIGFCDNRAGDLRGDLFPVLQVCAGKCNVRPARDVYHCLWPWSTVLALCHAL